MKKFDLQAWRPLLIRAALIALCVYLAARYWLFDGLLDASRRAAVLERELQSARATIEAERSRATVAEREADVMRRANDLLRGLERQHQDEVARLQADLALYRRLGGASGSQAPLAVHYLELQATGSPRVYRIIFTLTQNLRWAAAISGRIQLGVDGILDGEARHLTEAQLLPDSSEPLRFQFKYFQMFERLITLPEGFEANRLTIRLRAGGLRTPVERSADWQDLFNRAAVETGADAPPGLPGD